MSISRLDQQALNYQKNPDDINIGKLFTGMIVIFQRPYHECTGRPMKIVKVHERTIDLISHDQGYKAQAKLNPCEIQIKTDNHSRAESQFGVKVGEIHGSNHQQTPFSKPYHNMSREDRIAHKYQDNPDNIDLKKMNVGDIIFFQRPEHECATHPMKITKIYENSADIISYNGVFTARAKINPCEIQISTLYDKDGRVNLEILMEQSGKWYHPNDSKPFSGDFFVLYENVDKAQEGSLKDGVKVGKWTEWYESGPKKEESFFNDDGFETKSTIWYESGQMKSKGSIVESDGNKYKDGLWEEWHSNGEKSYEGYYKDCIKDKKHISYNSKGKKFKEENIKDGKLDGYWYSSNEDGTSREEGFYKNGKKEGKWTEWYHEVNANKKSEKNYENGKEDINGESTLWYKNGQKQENGFF